MLRGSMPWIAATLRGSDVFVRVEASGEYLLVSGRVEVRYSGNKTRPYFAGPHNLVRQAGGAILPDDECPPADNRGESKPATAGSKKASPAPGSEKSPKKGGWIAYTDGACTGNPGPSGSGFIVIGPDGEKLEGYDYLGEGTNNIAELNGILRAIQLVPNDAPSVVVHTDSKYAIGVLTKPWKPKVNKELIEEIRRLIASRREVQLAYVPGHSGIPLNERADELAREAVSRRKSKIPAKHIDSK